MSPVNRTIWGPPKSQSMGTVLCNTKRHTFLQNVKEWCFFFFSLLYNPASVTLRLQLTIMLWEHWSYVVQKDLRPEKKPKTNESYRKAACKGLSTHFSFYMSRTAGVREQANKKFLSSVHCSHQGQHFSECDLGGYPCSDVTGTDCFQSPLQWQNTSCSDHRSDSSLPVCYLLQFAVWCWQLAGFWSAAIMTICYYYYLVDH